MVAVLGANGAGKSTLARAVSGLVPPAAGAIRFDGRDITGLPAHRVRQLGLTYIPEGRGIFPGLSVTENLRMAVAQEPRRDRADAIDRAIDQFPVLGTRRSQRAGSLSGGEQQMLALARALAVSPKLVIADELSLGLAPLITESVFESLEQARRSGITIVLSEQFVHRALSMADTCVILTRGRVSWSGPATEAGTEVTRPVPGRRRRGSADRGRRRVGPIGRADAPGAGGPCPVSVLDEDSRESHLSAGRGPMRTHVLSTNKHNGGSMPVKRTKRAAALAAPVVLALALAAGGCSSNSASSTTTTTSGSSTASSAPTGSPLTIAYIIVADR